MMPVGVIALTALLFLSGCAGNSDEPALSQAGSGVPSESAAPAPPVTPEPTPSATQPVQVIDVSAVPATCDELIDPKTAAQTIGVGFSDLVNYTPEPYWLTTAELQGGERFCRWWGREDTVSSYFDDASQLTIRVLANAGTEFGAVAKSSRYGSTKLGKSSELRCMVSGSYRRCEATVLHDGYWINVELQGEVDASADVASSKSDVVALVSHMTDVFDSAGSALVQYQPPTGGTKLWTSCSQLDNGSGFREAIGAKKLGKGTFASYSSGPYSIADVSLSRARYSACEWAPTSGSGVSRTQVFSADVAMVEGGGWAWPQYLTSAIAFDPAAETAFVGADSGVVTCEEQQGDDEEYLSCSAQALVGNSLLRVLTIADLNGSADARGAAIAGMEYVIGQL
jgi:hypothetical protein